MARTNLGRTLPGIALAAALAFLAGCVPAPPPSATARANLHQSMDDGVQRTAANANGYAPAYSNPANNPPPSPNRMQVERSV